MVADEVYHALEEPTSLNTLELLPRLKQAGVTALKIEGRQRGGRLCQFGHPDLASSH